MEQYSRTKLLIGEEKFKRLQSAKVTVCGLGAVGGYVVEALEVNLLPSRRGCG